FLLRKDDIVSSPERLLINSILDLWITQGTQAAYQTLAEALSLQPLELGVNRLSETDQRIESFRRGIVAQLTLIAKYYPKVVQELGLKQRSDRRDWSILSSELLREILHDTPDPRQPQGGTAVNSASNTAKDSLDWESLRVTLANRRWDEFVALIEGADLSTVEVARDAIRTMSDVPIQVSSQVMRRYCDVGGAIEPIGSEIRANISSPE